MCTVQLQVNCKQELVASEKTYLECNAASPSCICPLKVGLCQLPWNPSIYFLFCNMVASYVTEAHFPQLSPSRKSLPTHTMWDFLSSFWGRYGIILGSHGRLQRSDLNMVPVAVSSSERVRPNLGASHCPWSTQEVLHISLLREKIPASMKFLELTRALRHFPTWLTTSNTILSQKIHTTSSSLPVTKTLPLVSGNGNLMLGWHAQYQLQPIIGYPPSSLTVDDTPPRCSIPAKHNTSFKSNQSPNGKKHHIYLQTHNILQFTEPSSSCTIPHNTSSLHHVMLLSYVV